jgi:hypothetical protein
MHRPRHAKRALLVALAVLMALAAWTPVASAKKTASPRESRSMWSAADPTDRCLKHRRATVSSHTGKRWRFGTVKIADRVCGTGVVLLRAPLRGSGWRVIGTGSDWLDRGYDCRADLRRAPLRVLRDLFGEAFCPTAVMSKCPLGVAENPSGGFGLIIEDLTVNEHITCEQAQELAGKNSGGNGNPPAGWSCRSDTTGRWVCVSRATPVAAFTYRFGGGAG